MAVINVIDPTNPVITIVLPAVSEDVFGIEVRKSDNTTVLYHADLSDAGYAPSVVDAGNTTRSLSYYVYTYNVLGEYSLGYHLTHTIPTPAISNLAVDDDTKLVEWDSTNATSFRVEVDWYSILWTHLTISRTFSGFAEGALQSEPFYLLADADFFPTRYIRVTPYDGLGGGTPAYVTHTYAETAVSSFGSGEVFVVAPPTSPTTDPVVPTDLIGRADAEYLLASWIAHKLNMERYE